MLMEPKGIVHLNDEGEEGIQVSRGGYTKQTLANGRFVVIRVQQNESYCSCTGSKTSVDSEKRLRYLTTLMNPHYVLWSRKPTNENHVKRTKKKGRSDDHWWLSSQIGVRNPMGKMKNWAPRQFGNYSWSQWHYTVICDPSELRTIPQRSINVVQKIKFSGTTHWQKIQFGRIGGAQHHHTQLFGNLWCIHIHQT